MKIFYACLIALLLSNSAWGARINVAAKANGGLASASSSYAGGIYPVEAINNGDHRGINLGGGSAWVWADGTANQYPDWAQITFNSLKTIDEIDVFTMQDNYASPIEPTATMTFNAYGLTAYDVQYWNGTTWVTVPGGSISNNNLVWRKINFPAIATDRIRVLVNAALADYSRVVEVEAYSVSNIPPTVSLSVPLNTYYAPASINLTANANDSDGTVSRVEYYNGTTLLSAATAAPYSYTWTNVPTGSYTLTAKAYDNANASTTSNPVNVIVYPVTTSAINVFYIYADHLNTPRVITDTANTSVWSWNSDPFGTSLANEDPDGDGKKFTYNLRFPGQYFDKETGLHYNYFRDYDPGTGRYVQSDPIGLRGGLNTYVYVNQNPISFIDPDGLRCTYTQNTGSLVCPDDITGQVYLNCSGYAGNGAGTNNPDAQNQRNVGPLPRGTYTVGGSTTRKGPVTRRLTPEASNTMEGRDGFLIHGDNARNNRSASEGCIIASRRCREAIPVGETLDVVR